jgi:hypothetical protein
MKWLAAGLVILTLGLAGCEDDVMTVSVPAHVHKIAIPTFKNNSSQPGIDLDLTQKVTQEFLNDGRLSVVPLQQADGLLEGTVQQYILLPLVRDVNQVPQQYKLQIIVDLDFTDLVSKKQLWTTRRTVDLTPQATPQATPTPFPGQDSINTAALSESTTYWVLNTMGVQPEDEATARLRVENQVAKRVVTRVLEGY